MKLDYPMRLQVYLARSGCGSRRSCEKLITEGRVQINMKTVTELGTKVERSDAVTLDGVPVEPSEKSYYIALNKPKGYVCANSDPYNKLYARDLIDIPDRALLFHVGRLDKDSTGLIIYTNDGELANLVMHPSRGIEKEYIVQTDRTVEKRDLERMVKGVLLPDDPRPYRIRRYVPLTGRTVQVVLTEGKNREIRRLFDAFGYEVKNLERIRIGNIELGNLKTGAWRKIPPEEIARLADLAAGGGRKGEREQ